MPFNPAPSALLPGYTSDGTNITIPLASLPGLTAAEADATTGDSREVIRAFMEQVYSHITALPAADKPARVTVTKPNPTPQANSVLRQGYTINFDTTYTTTNLNMAPEA